MLVFTQNPSVGREASEVNAIFKLVYMACGNVTSIYMGQTLPKICWVI